MLEITVKIIPVIRQNEQRQWKYIRYCLSTVLQSRYPMKKEKQTSQSKKHIADASDR